MGRRNKRDDEMSHGLFANKSIFKTINKQNEQDT
jgi:hypothetical protein